MTTIMLSHLSTQLKTMDPAFPDDYTQGVILCHWSERGRTRITLDGSELRAVLYALPTDMLVEVLGARSVLCTVGAWDDNELRTVLRAVPTDILVEVLGERGVLSTMGGEAPGVAEGHGN